MRLFRRYTPRQAKSGGGWGRKLFACETESAPPTCPPKLQRRRGPESSVRIFSNRHRQKGNCKYELPASLRSAANLYGIFGEKEMLLSIRAKEIFSF